MHYTIQCSTPRCHTNCNIHNAIWLSIHIFLCSRCLRTQFAIGLCGTFAVHCDKAVEDILTATHVAHITAPPHRCHCHTHMYNTHTYKKLCTVTLLCIATVLLHSTAQGYTAAELCCHCCALHNLTITCTITYKLHKQPACAYTTASLIHNVQHSARRGTNISTTNKLENM
jgi:hypothetical protein